MTALLRWLALLLMAGVALQLFFVLRLIGLLHCDPLSTTFQRSEAWVLWRLDSAASWQPQWQHEWLPWQDISDHLKRAVIAAEDSRFLSHQGIEWQVMERAWRSSIEAMQHAADHDSPMPLVKGGSTLSQQLAKNLLLSGERTALRKAQEILLTLVLEHLLSKQRILEIYLNSVEWGSGIFGAQAAAHYYFGKHASQLSAQEAAQLAVLLPAPKRYQYLLPYSTYLADRVRSVRAGMRLVQLPAAWTQQSHAHPWH